MRFAGGTVAPVALICPEIAVISAFSFLHSLESKGRSAFFFLVGMAGSLSTQSRGCELALLFSLSILTFRWAKTGKRTAYISISSFLALILLFGALLGTVGGGSIWRIVNRGESAQEIATASGRTAMWRFVIQYCLKHPQGMGYVAGFRMIFREQSASALNLIPAAIGNAHNGYFQVLADAGWLALAVYLVMLTKIVRLALRFANKIPHRGFKPDNLSRESIECSMLMLIYCLAEGMDTSGFSVPLTVLSHWQNIIVAIILSISARLILTSRTPRLGLVE
jgi:O-antigen ligase